MITTSTSALDFTAKKLTETTENQHPDFDTPSIKTINAILNFSRNLEIRSSKFVENIEFIKS